MAYLAMQLGSLLPHPEPLAYPIAKTRKSPANVRHGSNTNIDKDETSELIPTIYEKQHV